MGKNFAIIGCAGFIGPRHLKAIKETGNNLIAALDKSDSVGILDKFFDNVDFFTEFERFDRHAEKLKRLGDKNKINYVSICSPNYLHDSHIRFALRIGADAICEKPLVINPWNLSALQKLEEETGKRVYTVLQLRLHPALKELKKSVENQKIDADAGFLDDRRAMHDRHNKKKYDVDLTYITPRGKWYEYSWKGDISKSGGLATNIGIHFFDMLIWIFGKIVNVEVHHSDKNKIGGYFELENARVKWFLSIDKKDLPKNYANPSFRSIKIDGKELEFSDVFADLHTEVYKEILNGRGFGINDVRPCIELADKIRQAKPEIKDVNNLHPFLLNHKSNVKDGL